MTVSRHSTTDSFVVSELEKAFEAFEKRNPKSRKAHEEAHDHLPGGNTRTVIHAAPFPITWVYGQDSLLTSLDGHTYLDLLGEFSAGIYGHSNARIVDSIKKSLLGGWNFGGNSLHEKRLARVVCDRFKASGIELVRFTNSGTEANTTALGAALAITGKKKILVFSGGYHGSTLVFPLGLMRGDLDVPMNLPHHFIHAPYNNITETDKATRNHRQDLAAILVEPVQGSGGCRPATVEFMKYLRNLADQCSAMLIVDEVMASRLGPFGCSASMGVRGDLITLGKYIGGGMTIGAFGGRRDIMELFDPSKDRLFHPGTFNNNVVSMNCGLTGLEIFDTDAVESLNELGKTLKRKVQRILIDQAIYPKSIHDADSDIIEIDSLGGNSWQEVAGIGAIHSLPPMFITGRGSMLNVRFSAPDAASWQALFYHHMLTNNINVAVRGYTPLHLCLSVTDIERYAEAIGGFVAKYRDRLIQEPLSNGH